MLDPVSQLDMVELRVLLGSEIDTSENIPTSVRLLIEQINIFRELLRQIRAKQFLAHHRDRGERRAEFMRRRRRRPSRRER